MNITFEGENGPETWRIEPLSGSRTFRAEELSLQTQRHFMMRPGSTITFTEIDPNFVYPDRPGTGLQGRVCYNITHETGSTTGCGAITGNVSMAGRTWRAIDFVIPELVYPTGSEPFFRIDNPALWLGAGVIGLGVFLWWRERREPAGIFRGVMEGPPPPSNRCCPSGARMLSSGTCQDQSTKRFVKSIPCAQRMAPRRVMKVGMEPVRTWPAPRRIL